MLTCLSLMNPVYQSYLILSRHQLYLFVKIQISDKCNFGILIKQALYIQNSWKE